MPDGLHYYEWMFNDWLGSGTRAAMTLNDRAIYRDLLDHQAASGSLPDDSQTLANMAMCSVGQMEAFVQRYGDKLFPIGEDGARRNEKLQANRDAILARRNKRRSAGAKGAEARWHGKRNSNANGNAIGKRNADAMASHSQNHNQKNKEPPKPPGGGLGSSFWPVVVQVLPPSMRTDALRDAWLEYEQHRRDKRSRMTRKSAEKQAKALAEINDEQRAIRAIDHSIASGWTGIFEGRGPSGGDSSPAGNRPGQRRADEARRQGAEEISVREL